MAQPIYFLPHLAEAAANSVPLRSSVLAERGLAEIFAGVPFELQPCYQLADGGPEGLPGCVLCYQTPTGNIPQAWGRRVDRLTWHKVGDGSLLWIGIDPAELPTPEELARAKQSPGYSIALGDGQQWQIPVIRRPDDSTYLPSGFRRTAGGRLEEVVRPEYRSHWDDFRAGAEWAYGGMAPGVFPREQIVDLAVRALSINYRFGWNEQDVLQPIGRDNYLTVLAAAVDLPAFDATADAQKKSSGRSSGLSSTPGRPAGSPDIDPASPTSNS